MRWRSWPAAGSASTLKKVPSCCSSTRDQRAATDPAQPAATRRGRTIAASPVDRTGATPADRADPRPAAVLEHRRDHGRPATRRTRARTPATGRDRPGYREHPRQRATGRRRPSSCVATTTQAVHSINDQRPRTADPSIRKARCRTSGSGDPSRVRCRNTYPRPRIGRRPQTHR